MAMKVEKSPKKRWGLIAFMVFIMIGTSFSFVFYGFSPSGGKQKYNGFTFATNGNLWLGKINGNTAAFSYLPSDVEDIFSFKDFSSMLKGRIQIDVTSDANNTYKETIALAQHQMGLTFNAYGTYLRQGFTGNNSFGLAEINCDDASPIVPVIYFTSSNITEIEVQGNCIIAKASAQADFIRLKDRILYGYFGVIQ
jgi:hypothetical protein